MPTPLRALAVLAVLVGCHNRDDDDFRANVDCNDEDAKTFPGAPEVCDGIDNDCNGAVDDDPSKYSTFFADLDADRFGDPENAFSACFAPPGYVEDNTDCADVEPLTFPGNSEVCDGLDNDCNTEVDEGLTSTFFADLDGDGHGNAGSAFEACSAPPGYITDDTDCDDDEADAFPDNVETCDGVDNDCNGEVDDGTKTTFYVDVDGDGYGNAAAPYDACTAPPGYVSDNTDCDDALAEKFPGNSEVCDGVDNDCNAVIDEGTTSTFYYDADGDQHGNPLTPTVACTAPPGTVPDDTDCDDDNANAFPGNAEVCDGEDNDCNGTVDQGLLTRFYPDADADGFGNPEQQFDACVAPAGWVTDDTDCDDDSAVSFPGNPEVCDGFDNNCAGGIDNGVLTTFYSDADGDNFGSAAAAFVTCTAPPGFVADDTDCNDGDFFTWPGAPEACDGADNDCDTVLDNSGFDSDSDGIDNCNDPTVYDEDFGNCPGASANWTDWTVDEFADMPSGNNPGSNPLGMPVSGVPSDPEAWNWCAGTMSSGSLAAGHSAAVGPDHGQLNVFTVSALVSVGATNVDGVGVVFDWFGPDDFFLVRWDDPRNAYLRTTKLELLRCIAGTCSVLATDDPATTGGAGLMSFDIEVRYDTIDVYQNGVLALSTLTNGGDLGPGRVGVYAFSPDSGSSADSILITQP